MLAIVWPMSVPAFIPVVAVESWVVRRALNVSWRVAITKMVKGNVFSTLVGIPLAWVASVAVGFFLALLVMNATDSKSYPPQGVGEVGRIILSAPWLGPFREGGHWIVPLAMIVLLVPFFFASFWTEILSLWSTYDCWSQPDSAAIDFHACIVRFCPDSRRDRCDR